MVKKFAKIYEIKSSIDLVWKALVEPEMIDKWGGGKAEMTDKPGTKFSLWNKDIWGKNIAVENERLLKQEWYGGKWDKPSTVVFKLFMNGEKTTLELIHTDIPENEFEEIKKGWDDYYIGPLIEFCEAKSETRD